MALSPLPPAEDLRVIASRRVIPVGDEFSFAVVLGADPTRQLEGFEIMFPGFSATSVPWRTGTGGLHFRGRIWRPGFCPLAASAVNGGTPVTGRDYFVAVERQPKPCTAESGYYVFLGCGDYPIITGRETHPLASWGLSDWKNLVAWMGAHGMNRLWVLLNGYTLAYPSVKYPTLRDRHARNVTDDFLRELIDFAHSCGVKVYLMLTTDGHAREFSRIHPEAARIDASGAPCRHFGLALEHPRTREYIFGVLDEVLEFYPNADGVAVHPTESDPERANVETLDAYRRETGRDLRTETSAVRRRWYNFAFARFMQEFAARCHAARPDLDLVMANCWWQDDHVEVNRAELPDTLRIAVWYYAWEDKTPQPWPIERWIAAFGADRILYAPTSQSYLYPTDPSRVMDRHIGIDRLVSTAALHGVRDTMYFAGWDFPDDEARLLDVALVRHPTVARPSPDPQAILDALYSDYFLARQRLLKTPDLLPRR